MAGFDAMITALRKIEGRGEFPGATSAVLRTCVDNRREGLAYLFTTQSTVDNRVGALVRVAGGRHSRRITLLAPREPGEQSVPTE